MKRGTIALSKYRNEIIEVLSRFVIEYVRVGGEADNYYTIKKEAKGTVDHFLSDGVFTGGIALAFEQLREKLKL
jgi:intein-encoded DNA endonuclease-like protein